jgi:hypothetical protein
MPESDSTTKITKAIEFLKEAIANQDIDQKAWREDVVSATNILLGLLGLKAIGSDNLGGRD